MVKKRVALVLGGGGAFGFAHIGVLRLLKELDLKPDIIIGSSMGSIIGALYAVGHSVEFMEVFAKTFDYKLLLDFFSKSIRKRKGILIGNNALDLYRILTKNQNFEDISIPFYINATDFFTGEEYVFNTGNIAKAIRASTSIPWIFEPYKIEGKLYVDGGVYDSLPVHIAQNLGIERIIAVGFSNINKNEPQIYKHLREKNVKPGKLFLRKLYNNKSIKAKVENLSHFEEVFINIENMLNIVLWSEISDNKHNADIYICPDMDGYTQLNFFNAQDIIESGYSESLKYKEEIIKLFD